MSAHRKTLIFLVLIMLVLSILTSFVSGLVKVATAASTSKDAFFEDDFSGTAIDGSKWNSTFATSGFRWCSFGIPSATNQTPGNWQDTSATPCNGTTQSPPHGTISEQDGSASFTASSSRAFPYIWRGQPSKPSPFPATGDFVLEVRLKYDVITGSGAGFAVSSYTGTDAIGDNPTNYPGRILTIWADSSGLRVALLGSQASVFDDFGQHDYVMAYANGQYSVTVDGFPLLQPVSSAVRANAIWVGNPFFAFWAIQDWSSFGLSMVRVGNPTLTLNPGSGSLGTMVTVQGDGFPMSSGLSQLEITFDNQLLGFASPLNGSFTLVFNVPHADATKPHHIHAVTLFPTNLDVAADFSVLPEVASSTLGVNLSTGAIYFPGDIVTIYIETTQNGGLAGPEGMELHLSIMRPNGTTSALNAGPVGRGLYKASFTVPKIGSTGTYAVTATASVKGMQASALGTFEVKQGWVSPGGPNVLSALSLPDSMPTVAILGMMITGVAVLGLAFITRRVGK